MLRYVSGVEKVRWEDQERLREQIDQDQPCPKKKRKVPLRKEKALRQIIPSKVHIAMDC